MNAPTSPILYKGGTTLEQREQMRTEMLLKSQKAMLDTFTWQSCANCINWKNDQCDLYKMRPPVQVIAIGCATWEADIPF